MSKKILIVEDEVTLNDAYRMILEAEGYKVACAFDGNEALQLAEEFDPDLILLDLRMPKLNGIDFLKEYDVKVKHPKVKIIIFSNLDMQAEIDEGYKLGADRYMLKAWASPKELSKLIKATLAGKH
jgi:two-component system, OmpR family, response regulator VicR